MSGVQLRLPFLAAAVVGLLLASGGGAARLSSGDEFRKADWEHAAGLQHDSAREDGATARSRQLQPSSGRWLLHPGCLAGQNCTVNGTCLNASAYYSTTTCGSGVTVSVSKNATSNCRDAGCGYKNCAPDEVEVSSKFCWGIPPSFNERCCKAAFNYTCRDYLQCSWVPAPSPPPPVSSMAVFAAKGAWNPAAKTDVKTNAYIAIVLAATIYEDTGEDNEVQFNERFTRLVSAPLGATRTKVYYQLQDTQWAFLDTPGSIILVFRGTAGAEDAFVSDLTSFMTDPAPELGGGNIRIGQGFYRAFSKNKDFLMSELSRFVNTSSNPSKPLWFTGHSLGGALATLFGAYCKIQGYNVGGVYTFGSPIVGNDAWKAAYPLSNITYRYDNQGDPVPKLPPFLGGVKNHVGITVNLTTCPASDAAVAMGLQKGGRRIMMEMSAASQRLGSLPRSTALEPGGDLVEEVSAGAAGAEESTVGPLVRRSAQAAPSVQRGPLPSAGGTVPAAAAPSPSTTGSSPTVKRSAHSSGLSYLPNIYYCVLTPQQQATVPSFPTVLAILNTP